MAYSSGTVRSSSPTKGVYDPRAFILHAASLGQAFAHCPRFLAAASRRSQGRVSVPVWLIILSDQLPVIGLVGRYPTNYLIGRRPLRKRIAAFLSKDFHSESTCGISSPFGKLFPTSGQVAYVLLSRPPLSLADRSRLDRSTCMRKARR